MPSSVDARASRASTTSLQYDTLGLASAVKTDRLAFDQHYDEGGNLKSSTPPNRGTTTYVNDPAGLPKSETKPDGATTRFEHDATGAASKFTDAESEATKVDRDLIGRTLRRLYPDGTAEAFEYQGARLLTETDRQGNKQLFASSSILAS